MLKKCFVSSLLLLSSVIVNGAELQTEESKLLVQELRSKINSTLAEVVMLEKAAGNKKVAILLQEEGRKTTELGLLREPNSGLVLSVSPNSNAKMLGIEIGDQLLSLYASKKSMNLQMNMSFKAGDLLSAKVLREGAELTLEGFALKPIALAWDLKVAEQVPSEIISSSEPLEGCGKLSVFFTPPEAREIYPAYIKKINGETVPRFRENFKRASGKYLIDVHELIPAREIGRRTGFLQKAKPLEIIIEPGKAYYIGAKFIRNKRFNQRKAEYWEPVVWKVSDVSCEL